MAQGRSILVVDDDPVVVAKARLVLEDDGYTVFTAATAADAIDKLGVITPSVILLDVTMPGENGYQLCSRIRSDYPHVRCPIVFLTANNTTDHIAMAKEAGGDYFVIKPFSDDMLITGIKRGFMAHARRSQTI